MASSSSSLSTLAFPSQVYKYHVFLSFRGEDTRKTFVDHLYSALEQKGIYTYKDDETLPRGESIGPSLMTAIEESQIAVIIFSKNYADSSWCLNELLHIMKCKDTKSQIVMPIFYDVDPSEVRKQKSKYGEAFLKHELESKQKVLSWGQAFLDDLCGWFLALRVQLQKIRESQAKHELEKKKVESWRKALVDASNISGWEPQRIANGHESKCILEIVDTISQRLYPLTSIVDDNLVGVRARMQDLISKLEIGFGGKRFIGIWGVGGGGKTTLASCIYDEISSKFDGSCFIKNVREESSIKNGLENLQEKILCGVLQQKQLHVERVEEGRRMIKDRLHHRKVLIVLDDVDSLEQLEELVGSRDWFGERSRIVITTRDEHVLTGHKVDVIHNINLLNNDEAMKLLCKHAPCVDKHIEDYEVLSKEVVSYAGGLPLALRVLGRFLGDKDMNEWRCALARLKEIPDNKILDKLKISFDGLRPVERELFLDIACFFRWWPKEEGMMILDACGFHPGIGIKVLVQKALITISSKGRFDMHDLVEEMAHHIVRGEHPRNPEYHHSRVWKKKDFQKIFAMDAMTNHDMIEALDAGRWWFPMSDYAQRVLEAAANMKKLRWIKLDSGLGETTLPVNFPPWELRCLILRGLRAKQLWGGNKFLPNLRMIKLSYLSNLMKTPDFDGLLNLERFMVTDSPLLEEIHPSFGHLEKLVCVEINGDIRSAADWELPNLQELNLAGNKFLRLNFSLLQLPRLKWLDVSLSDELVELSELPSSIAVVIADGCRSLESFGDISNCKWLWKVSLLGDKKLGLLGGDILLKSMLQGNAKYHFISMNLSSSEFWRRCVPYLNWVKTLTMLLPHNWYDYFCGILMFVKSDEKDVHVNIIFKQVAEEYFQSPFGQESNEAEFSFYGTVCVGYVSFSSLTNTACLNSTYNMLSFSVNEADERRFRVVLVPRKSRDDQMQTTDCSEFWDNGKTFTVQHYSGSSINILWTPHNREASWSNF